MLRVYYYRDDEITWKGKPVPGPLGGPLRFPTHLVQEVENPGHADIFVYPHGLNEHWEAHIQGLKYMRGREDRHVFFDCSDWPLAYSLPCIFVRGNLKNYMKEADPNSISWPWPVYDLGEWTPMPADGFKFDVSFLGRVNASVVREDVLRSCVEGSGLRCDFGAWPEFHGYVKDAGLRGRREKEFYESNQRSRLVLAPESIRGVLTYRFYEAMSQARVPAIFGDYYNLPFDKRIDWDSCCVQFSVQDAKSAGSVLRRWLDDHDDEEIVKMGERGRWYWERYCKKVKWPMLLLDEIEEQLQSREE